MNIRIKLIFAAFVISILVMSSFQQRESQEQTLISKAQRKTLSDIVEFNGKIQPTSVYKITAPMIGIIESINVKPRQWVEKGQLLAQIEDDFLQFDLQTINTQIEQQLRKIEKHKLEFELLNKRYQRKKNLLASEVITIDEFQRLELERKKLIIDIENGKTASRKLNIAKSRIIQQINKSQIRSPISGMVNQVAVNLGETVLPSSANLPGSVLFVVVNKQKMEVIGNLSEIDLPKINIGQQVEVSLPAFPDIKMTGEISEIMPSTSEAGIVDLSSQFPVHVRLLDSPVELVHGMTAQIKLINELHQSVLTLPIASVQSRIENNKEKYGVFIASNDGEYKFTEIEVGIIEGDYLEVTKGLEGDEQILLGPDTLISQLMRENSYEIN